ncbi:DUF2318 domain-containing protein [Aminipila butyrica]|uniref:DUF2318 domain-containing protein n=2 Tax=Aminipila butyrica TaxID=433296 RepID=A0A858C216_9FIRM|nr:DUF2318 domain-containing protein [Aminipila butyrica]
MMMSLVLVLAGCGAGASGGGGNDEAGEAERVQIESDAAQEDNAQEIKTGESLTIQTADITETATFYPLKIDDTAMEVLAVKAADGTIRTAFNTCEVCYGSGRGYYKQEGDTLVCQNCGNRFSTDQVEVQSRGCNPWPIFDENKTTTDDTITISYDFLSESKTAFENWKQSY